MADRGSVAVADISVTPAKPLQPRTDLRDRDSVAVSANIDPLLFMTGSV
jgi:hypothetical protein